MQQLIVTIKSLEEFLKKFPQSVDIQELAFYTVIATNSGIPDDHTKRSEENMELQQVENVRPRRRQKGTTRLAIYDFIIAFSEKNGFPPTIREIAQAVGLSSPGTVSMHLKRLEEDHLIKRYTNHARAIRVQDIL
jgi:DNA-binding transcriptional ArsR family regulator